MKILPYTKYDGIPTLRDSDIAGFYEKMVRDKTADIVFYDGMIKDWQDFLSFVTSPKVLFFVAHDGAESVGCGWLTDIKHKSAQAHFCMFSEIWDKNSVEVGRAIINAVYSFTTIELLIGYVPEINPVALKFAKKCGAVELGKMPCGSVDKNGVSHPTTIVYYAR